jgi:hypothetical protein
LVKATRKPYREQGDTISYDVAAYADGSERKIEDIIKRLPGVTVNERSGEIKYKGKLVETVNLDGDNLFGQQYVIGTRNINANAIKKVEAIDNYNENPVLHGLAADGKVALNLVLKERAFDLSGSADLGLGIQAQPGPALNLGGTLLGIGKKIKSFSTLSHNNIGYRHAPFDPFSLDLAAREEDREDFAAVQPVQTVGPPSVLGSDDRTHRNAEYFGSVAGLVRWSPKLTTRLRLSGLRDALPTNTFFRNDYRFNDTILLTSDVADAEAQPRVANGNLRLLYDANPHSRLEYLLDATALTTNARVGILRNGTDGLQTDLRTTDDKLSQFLLWSKRLNKKKAIEIKVKHTEQTIQQRYRITPSVTGTEAGQDEQFVDNAARAFRARADLVGRWRRAKYRQGVEARSVRLHFTSHLAVGEEQRSRNDFIYANNSLALRGSAQFRWGKFRFHPAYELVLMNRMLNNRANEERRQRSDLLFRPKADARYDFNRNNRLKISYAYEPASELEDHLYGENLLIDQRTLVSHEPSLQLRQGQRFDLTYFHNNLQHEFEVSAGVFYQINSGNFYPNFQIGSLLTRLRYVYAPLTNNTASGNWKISKYLAPLNLTVMYKGNYSLNKYRNVVGEGTFRNNTANWWSNKLILQLSPKIPFSLNQTVGVDYSRARSEGLAVAENTGLVSQTRLTSSIIKSVSLSLTLETFRPDLSNRSGQRTFLDAGVRYRPKDRPWELNASLRNLTNVREFRQVSVSDVATTVSSIRLLPRQMVVRLSRSF